MAAARWPARLRPGDEVAVLSVSGPPDPAGLREGLARLHSMGLRPVLLPTASVHPGHPVEYLAGTDEQRAADLTAALTDPRFRGVFFARGGYGAQRMIDLVDFDALAGQAPRQIVGFSDVTEVHSAMAARLNWVTWYAPMVATWYFEQRSATDDLRARLFEPLPADGLRFEAPDVLVPGTASGRLSGGCLSLLISSIGTRTERRPAGEILFLEDVEEQPYRLDRMVTQGLRAGYFDDVAGVVLGTFDQCGDPAEVRAMFLDRLGEPLRHRGVPMLGGLAIGHGVPLRSLPLGAHAHLEGGVSAGEGALHLDRAENTQEPCVILEV